MFLRAWRSQELARRTGEPIEEAVATALKERLASLVPPVRRKPDPQVVEALLARFRALPDLDSRSPEEILGCKGGDFPKTDLPLVST